MSERNREKSLKLLLECRIVCCVTQELEVEKRRSYGLSIFVVEELEDLDSSSTILSLVLL